MRLGMLHWVDVTPKDASVMIRIRIAEVNPVEEVARRGFEPHIFLLAEVSILVNLEVLVVKVESPDGPVGPPIVAEGVRVRDRKAHSACALIGTVAVRGSLNCRKVPLAVGVRERPRAPDGLWPETLLGNSAPLKRYGLKVLAVNMVSGRPVS